jgi:hypothetical protein
MGWFNKCPVALVVSASLLAGSLLTAGTALAVTKSIDFDLVVSKRGNLPAAGERKGTRQISWARRDHDRRRRRPATEV